MHLGNNRPIGQIGTHVYSINDIYGIFNIYIGTYYILKGEYTLEHISFRELKGIPLMKVSHNLKTATNPRTKEYFSVVFCFTKNVI